jgi:hypothetical protein
MSNSIFGLNRFALGGFMKSCILTGAVSMLLFLWLSRLALAQEGEPYIHDPSTIMLCDGKYYTFGTGGGGLISNDGWIRTSFTSGNATT